MSQAGKVNSSTFLVTVNRAHRRQRTIRVNLAFLLSLSLSLVPVSDPLPRTFFSLFSSIITYVFFSACRPVVLPASQITRSRTILNYALMDGRDGGENLLPRKRRLCLLSLTKTTAECASSISAFFSPQPRHLRCSTIDS